MIPIEDKIHKERVRGILDLYLRDNQKAHVMRADGSYRKLVSKTDKVSAQETLMKEAKQASEHPKMTVVERMQPMFKE